jgi:tRNA-specific 2-thiouridylase
MDQFADAYMAGETPIPCVACNQQIKFADLFDTAMDLGADLFATGHYIASRAAPDGERALYRAADADRDQSYFLFSTERAQLEKLRFPLGDMPKSEVRDLARSFDLVVADKPDSQDICFVPAGKYTDVIERLRPGAIEAGDIVHVDGRVLGQHSGVIHYTIGQRRGLGITDVRAGGGEPLFVVRIDALARQVIVGPREALATHQVHLRDVNWIGPGALVDLPETGLELAVRLRSTRPPAPAILYRDAQGVRVELLQGETGVSPGQACVFYQSSEPNARVLGGGFIKPMSAASPVASQAVQASAEATAQATAYDLTN